LTPESLPDGSSSTLHLVEVSDSGVHWMEPRDLSLDRMDFRINRETGVGIRSRHPVGANVSFSDGQVATLPAETAPETVKAMLLRDDGGPQQAP
jgi:prepilin-type processing-associated H-X9-DG protein